MVRQAGTALDLAIGGELKGARTVGRAAAVDHHHHKADGGKLLCRGAVIAVAPALGYHGRLHSAINQIDDRVALRRIETWGFVDHTPQRVRTAERVGIRCGHREGFGHWHRGRPTVHRVGSLKIHQHGTGFRISQDRAQRL